MHDDLPTIAIIGAGPIGLEATLYARYLGYPVTLFEKGDTAAHVREWEHVPMFSPFGMNSSSLGISAIQAQNPSHVMPEADRTHTGKEWIDQYLEPLAKSDLVRPCLRAKNRVLAVGRDTAHQTPTDSREDAPFRILVSDETETQRIEHADIVIDTSGSWGHPNPMGMGNIYAVGESPDLREQLPDKTKLQRGIPDLAKLEISKGARFAIIGSGFSAATNVLQLKTLQEHSPDIRGVWLTRGRGAATGPLAVLENDALPQRDALARDANAVANDSSWLEWKPEVEVTEIQCLEECFQLTLSNDEQIEVEYLIGNTGSTGDFEMLSGLQIHRCYVSGGPMAWAASMADASSDCLQQTSPGPEAIKTTEPNCFIIGSKAYGNDPRFLFATGLQQIRDVFKVIAERDTLDLYATLKPNLST